MDGTPTYEVPSEMKYSDIIIPTVDTVRNSFLLQLLLTNHKTVSHIDAGCPAIVVFLLFPIFLPFPNVPSFSYNIQVVPSFFSFYATNFATIINIL